MKEMFVKLVEGDLTLSNFVVVKYKGKNVRKKVKWKSNNNPWSSTYGKYPYVEFNGEIYYLKG